MLNPASCWSCWAEHQSSSKPRICLVGADPAVLEERESLISNKCISKDFIIDFIITAVNDKDIELIWYLDKTIQYYLKTGRISFI